MTELENISKLSITDFRSISGTITVPLDAPIILIHGPNGTGKTSVLSALELALTGNVKAMSDDDHNFARHLVHHGAKQAKITITEKGGQEAESGSFVIEDGRIVGDPYLDTDDQRFFGERCYLAQSMLGRLLDIYQNSKVEGESALTQFVKDLLGLNQLDSLIDGLHAAGHKTRTKNLVPEYGSFEMRIERCSSDITQLTGELSGLNSGRLEIVATLTQAVSLLFPEEETQSFDVATVGGRLAAFSSDTKLVEATRRLTELRSLSSAWSKLPRDADAEERGTVEVQELAARMAADDWRSTTGLELENLTTSLRGIFPDLPSWSSADPGTAFNAAGERVDGEIARIAAAIEADAKAEAQEAEIGDAVAKEEARGDLIDLQIGGIAADAGDFAAALAVLIPHIHTEDCPVCGRDFAEISEGEPLALHLQKTVAKYTEDAGRLSDLSKEKSLSSGRLAQLRRDLATLKSRRISTDAKVAATKSQADMAEYRVALDRLAVPAKGGASILAKEVTLRSKLASFRERDRTASELLDTARRIAGELVRTDMADMPFEAVLIDLAKHAENDVERLGTVQTQRGVAIDALQRLTSTDQRRKVVADSLAKATGMLGVLKAAVTELERLKAQAKVIADTAQDARTAIVRRVFNDDLNTLWRDLFVRLAPTEPFVPAFMIPSSDSKDFAKLETVHRNGKKGGTPGSMLSAGNLNTAALTLFLALHFSVGSRLPWLVLDDPVQNMDEVHVAQFAALLRTVSRAHGTKIVIAVHERTLFEYLKLELSPSYEKDRLLALELRRATNEPTVINPELLTYIVDAVAA